VVVPDTASAKEAKREAEKDNVKGSSSGSGKGSGSGKFTHTKGATRKEGEGRDRWCDDDGRLPWLKTDSSMAEPNDAKPRLEPAVEEKLPPKARRYPFHSFNPRLLPCALSF